jgi:hypothetical protein
VVTNAHSLGVVVTDRAAMKVGVGYAASSVLTATPDLTKEIIDTCDRPVRARDL